MAARRRSLREDERALWALVARDVAPLRQARRLPPGADTRQVETSRDRQTIADVPSPPLRRAMQPDQSEKAGAGGQDMGAAVTMEQLLAAGFSGVPGPSVRVALVPASADRIGQRQPGVDDYNWRRFSQGGMRADLRLDLHGMVAQDAFRRLMEFLDVATRRGARCVEIITGLGSGQEGGVLRRELPLWLERPEIRPRILGLAYPHVGNKGSVRVLLRRRKIGSKAGS
ncbi:MAG: Smr/MutS family protein [Acetobacter peroxydans]|nr:Smr/MutS family protein [Acetobacter peroxydans]MCI2078063.1 Smr/MutS family protein [Acetobacter peroxydans]